MSPKKSTHYILLILKHVIGITIIFILSNLELIIREFKLNLINNSNEPNDIENILDINISQIYLSFIQTNDEFITTKVIIGYIKLLPIKTHFLYFKENISLTELNVKIKISFLKNFKSMIQNSYISAEVKKIHGCITDQGLLDLISFHFRNVLTKRIKKYLIHLLNPELENSKYNDIFLENNSLPKVL